MYEPKLTILDRPVRPVALVMLTVLLALREKGCEEFP